MKINVFFGIFLMIVPISWIIKSFIYDPLKINKAYRVYKLRDDVALLAMSGKIAENNSDYQLLMLLINSEINIRKRNKDSFQITQYVKCVISPQTSSDHSVYKFESLAKNEILMPYTKEAIKFTSSRLNKSLKKLRICLNISLPFIELVDLILHHNIGITKNYKKNALSEYDKIQKKYGEIVSSVSSQIGY